MLETVQEKQSCPDAPTLSLAYLAYSTLGPVQLGTDLPACLCSSPDRYLDRKILNARWKNFSHSVCLIHL